MIMRFMRRAVCGAMDSSGLTSSSRFKPCGVSSKTQLKISAGMKPIASKITMLRGNQSGAPNIGSTVPATCTSSQAPTRYNPAKRMTLRRFSSAKKFMSFVGPLNSIAFEICLAERAASGGPAFLAPIRREAVAHDHRLDARIAQHRVSRRPAVIKIGEVVSLEYHSLTFDVCVVAVDVFSRDKISARFAFGRIRDRRAQFNRIDIGLAERPRQQGLCKHSIL